MKKVQKKKLLNWKERKKMSTISYIMSELTHMCLEDMNKLKR